jgi:hypothetical protein
MKAALRSRSHGGHLDRTFWRLVALVSKCAEGNGNEFSVAKSVAA